MKTYLSTLANVLGVLLCLAGVHKYSFWARTGVRKMRYCTRCYTPQFKHL